MYIYIIARYIQFKMRFSLSRTHNTVVVFIRPFSLVLVVRISRESGGMTLKGVSAVAPSCLSVNSSADGALFMWDVAVFQGCLD